ncbi:MAG: tetratricopeptide repeat protein, partial [Myxococcota bacterium]
MALNKRKVLEAARKHAQKGAKAKALKEYNKLLKEDPRDAKLLLEVGDAYRRWGQNEEAIAQYGKVAQQYRQDGFDARAVAVFKQILNLDPKNYGAYVSLSELYQRMGLDSEAVAALQTAADGYHKEGRKTEALDLLRQMAALDPTNTTSRLKVAELLRQEGMENEAVAEYEAVVAELESQDDREQLVTVLERLLEVKPDKIEALSALVRQLMLAGDLERAEPLAVRALNIDASIGQFELLMDLYAQMGDEAKLADATRGLAKIYRDRGDDEKARELMQRLPVEEVGSSSRLAVDVSEVDEPDLAEDELLDDDEPFLALDDGPGGDGAPSLELGEEPLLDLGSDDTPAPEASPPTQAEAPLPEGDPDQLLAEASVYLRYGKRDQAIASLRGILAQDPSHRAALEKLGEAYADDGQHSEAVQAWMKAAECIRAEGDAEALTILKDRIASLDPGMAEQIGDVEPGAAPEPEPPVLDLEPDGDALEPPAIDLDLDVEVDLNLDTAIGDVEGSETQTGYDFGSEDDDFEIELDEDSITFDTPPVASPEAAEPEIEAAAPVVEQTAPEIVAGTPSDDEDFEIEVDADDLGLAEGPDAANEVTDPDDEISVEFDYEAEELTSPPGGSVAGQSAATAAKIAEELEEAEFYIAQDMHDEARGILERILEQAPNHPAAMLRLGELAAANGEAPDEVTDSGLGAKEKKAGADLEITARFDDEAEDDFEVDVD